MFMREGLSHVENTRVKSGMAIHASVATTSALTMAVANSDGSIT